MRGHAYGHVYGHACGHVHGHVHGHVCQCWVDPYGHMHMNICMDMSVNMCMDMCVDMCVDICGWAYLKDADRGKYHIVYVSGQEEHAKVENKDETPKKNVRTAGHANVCAVC